MAAVTALPQPPPTGFAVPSTHHAVSVQMNTWRDMQGMMLGEPRVKKVQQIGYPRSFLHPDVVKVHSACLSLRQKGSEACLVYPAANHATSCKDYLVQIAKGEVACRSDDIDIRAIEFEVDHESLLGINTSNQAPIIRLYAVFFPVQHLQTAMGFWRLTGTGISSRLAESLHRHLRSIRFAPSKFLPLMQVHEEPRSTLVNASATNQICERISYLLKRASLEQATSDKPSASDVFLYPTGMSAIYHCNFLLQQWRPTESIVFGFPYELTLKLLQTYGQSCRFYGFGTPDELDQLEQYVRSEASHGRRVQSVWCECASNPLLRTVDLNRIRSMADKYGFQVVLDDTIGSFANVDVMGVADIVVTSLTKSFSGNGDVMGGSIVLNPISPFYETMKDTLSRKYRNELHGADAVKLEYNSRKFLPRASRMNQTALYLVSLLQCYALTPSSTLTHVYYPSTCWSLANYQDRMRLDSPEFTPGFGGLFTLEFESETAASTFFNVLEIHKGPSLGVCVTLAQPYVQTVFARDKQWAASYGLSETIVRISVGLEDEKLLVLIDRITLQAVGPAKPLPCPNGRVPSQTPSEPGLWSDVGDMLCILILPVVRD
ncbi:MAG: hypothetical protein Q9201_002591 [Fulgogasparrea decipioides]